jgi:hypothetical protein
VPVTRRIALAFVLLTGACASTPGDRGARESAKKPLRGGVAEFRVTSYDGRVVEGRALLGATVDPLVIDGRLFENLHVELEKIRACGKAELLKYWRMEYLPRPPRPDEMVTLQPGYWYGGNMHFFLFDEITGPGPECFEAELMVRTTGWRLVATLPIRVVRTDKPPTTPAGGTEEPKPPASDAGAP